MAWPLLSCVTVALNGPYFFGPHISLKQHKDHRSYRSTARPILGRNDYKLIRVVVYQYSKFLHIAINFYHVEIWDSYDGFFYNLNWMLVSICMLNCHHMEMWISTFLDDSKKKFKSCVPFSTLHELCPFILTCIISGNKKHDTPLTKELFLCIIF